MFNQSNKLTHHVAVAGDSVWLRVDRPTAITLVDALTLAQGQEPGQADAGFEALARLFEACAASEAALSNLGHAAHLYFEYVLDEPEPKPWLKKETLNGR